MRTPSLSALVGAVLAAAATTAPAASQETLLGDPLASYDEGMSFVQTVPSQAQVSSRAVGPLAVESFPPWTRTLRSAGS